MDNPIVILHGWGLSKDRYGALSAELQKKGFRVFSFDFPGFGAEKAPENPLVLTDYVQFLNAYLKKNKLKNPVLVGHSFGGRVALKYQYVHPGEARALILTGTPGFTPVAKRKLMVLIALAKIGKIFLNIPFIRDWFYYVAGARDYYRAQGPMKQTFKNIVQEQLVDYMRSVRIPTLLVWGEHDMITPVWIARKMSGVIGNSKLIVIPESDHGVSYKKPELFVATIYDFLLSVTKH